MTKKCYLSNTSKITLFHFYSSNKVSSKEALGKCGCVGGCTFFGANANGIGFFKPSKKDIERRCNVAIPTLNDRIQNPGYGQSILKDCTFTVRDCRYVLKFILNVSPIIVCAIYVIAPCKN